MNISLSFWDLDFYKEQDYILLGGGIVGINAAIHLKKLQPNKKVLIIDDSWLGGGASSKNAGFVCYGSPTEILDDIENSNIILAAELIERRWEGSKKLLEMVPPNIMDFNKVGGTEVFEDGTKVSKDDIILLNTLMLDVTKIENYFQIGEQSISNSFHSKSVEMREEGRIDPKKMMNYLYQIAIGLGVHFLNDTIIEIIASENLINLKKYGQIKFGKCGVTLNGYINQVIQSSNVTPVRNVVLITEDIPDLRWDKVVHFNKGYVYFRKIGNKILLGGGRNIDFDAEYSSEVAINQKIHNYLLDFLYSKILKTTKVEVIHQYVGILGFGNDKIPRVKSYTDTIFIASGMGGMGVAIGSKVGLELAEHLVK